MVSMWPNVHLVNATLASSKSGRSLDLARGHLGSVDNPFRSQVRYGESATERTVLPTGVAMISGSREWRHCHVGSNSPPTATP
jgi:hypothetical protein